MPCKDLGARRVYAREYYRSWIKKNPDKRRGYEKAWRLRNPRSLLCDRCNITLGFLESPLRAASEEYLARWSMNG